MLNRRPLPNRAPAFYLLTGLIAGLLAARSTPAPVGFALCTATTLAAVSIWLSSRHSLLWGVSFLAAATLAFWAYGSLRLPEKPEPYRLELPLREATLHLSVERVMQTRNPYDKATGSASIVEASPTSRLKRGDRVFFRLELPDDDSWSIIRGIELRATGVLEPISDDVAPDSFEAYLKDTGIHYRFDRSSRLEIVRPPSRFERFCATMNHRFQNYLRLGAPEADSLDGIYIAMLLGEKAELNDEQTDRFRITGTMHFFAISGLHIGVIATVIAQFLVLIRVPRRLSPFIGLPLLYLYVEITGASPSAVRAFLMALFFWASFAFMRQRSPLAALVASAVFVLAIDPEQLWSLGFQLSYTVVLSILLLGLPLYTFASERLAPFRYLPHANWSVGQRVYAWTLDALLLLFTISFSAWLASAPLGAAFFGYLSPGAVFLNMALVNLAALAISTGVIALSVATLGMEGITAFINHGAWLTIHTMDSLVAWSAGVPGMILHCDGFPESIAYATLFSYFVLLFWIHGQSRRRIIYVWAAPGLVVVGLMLGLFLL